VHLAAYPFHAPGYFAGVEKKESERPPSAGVSILHAIGLLHYTRERKVQVSHGARDAGFRVLRILCTY